LQIMKPRNFSIGGFFGGSDFISDGGGLGHALQKEALALSVIAGNHQVVEGRGVGARGGTKTPRT